MRAVAARRTPPPGSAPVEISAESAGALPLPDGSVDVAVSTQVRTRVVPLLDVGFDPNTYSATIAPAIGEFVTGRAGITADDVRDWLDDITSQGENGFFSLNRYAFLGAKPDGEPVTPLPASPG